MSLNTFTHATPVSPLQLTFRKGLAALSAAALLLGAGCSTTSTTASNDDSTLVGTPPTDDTMASNGTSDAYEGTWPGPGVSQGADQSITTDRVIATIYFDYDSASLDRANGMGIDAAERWLRENPDQSLLIVGHADPRGSHPYNQELALERAESAASALINRGISRERIVLITYGEEDLVEGGTYAEDRRVTFQTDPANAYGHNDEDLRPSKVVVVTTASR